MFLGDGMMENGESRFNSEREVRREVITDLKQVYYRGRYWASTAWSKVGNTRAPGSEPGIDADGAAEAVDRAHRKARAGAKSTA
jgi:hypothetical protein